VAGIDRQAFLDSYLTFDVYVFYANQETITYDQETAALLKERRRDAQILFTGPYATVRPEKVMECQAIDGVIRGETEIPLRAVCDGTDFSEIRGLTWRDRDSVVSNPDAGWLEDLDSLPWASRIIRRDLPLLKYRIPYLNHPYISLFSGRGCPNHCTYCLWPQTVGGHRYRKRSISDVAKEMIWIRDTMPGIREIQIEDDTFTCDRDRVLELCDLLEGRGIMWSCCSRHDLPKDILSRMKKAGVRNLVVGFESGNDEILKRAKKGVNTGQARRFMEDCRSVGIRVHGCFVFGLPGETPDTMQQTLDYALELRANTVQFTIAAAYEGTAFNSFLREQGFLRDEHGITQSGHLSARYDYPGLTSDQINEFTHHAWRSYYLRPSTIFQQFVSALTDFQDAKRFYHGVMYVGDYLFMKQPHQKC
jgi:radical SAM superfamily enzyme YgiQ (UPF0313 family)